MKFRKNDLDGEKGLSEEFVLRMFKAIHQESIVHQESD
jgi:chorismate mutase